MFQKPQTIGPSHKYIVYLKSRILKALLNQIIKNSDTYVSTYCPIFDQLGCLLSNTDWKVNIFFAGESVESCIHPWIRNLENKGYFYHPCQG